MSSEADNLIARLQLQPHPEGGHYRQTFVDTVPGGRAHSTAIYFLLKAGEISRWHRVDAAEAWLWHRGAPLELKIGRQAITLGAAVETGEQPQAVVPPGEWQMARSLGDYTLVSCTVAPGFDFAHYELPPEGFDPFA